MSLIIPASARPSNLHLAPHQVRFELDGETLHWLEHLPEEVQDGDRLFVVIHEDHPEPFVVMEHADDGTDMFVLRTDRLDAKTYETLRRARFIPLHKRLAAFEKEEAKHQADQKQHELDELYERIGGPMYRELHRNGFAHGRAESFPKRGPKAKKLWRGSR
jgi:hypothetical protein